MKTREIKLGDAYEGESVITIWCDGRDYDPVTEAYQPIYSYSIVTPNWRYDANDIRGKQYETPDLKAAEQSLLAFLLACIEAKEDSENYDLFPEQVREWANHFSNELIIQYMTHSS